MTGETDLSTLLKSMKPEVQEGEFVFCSLDPRSFRELTIEALCTFREREGVTLILSKKIADKLSLEYSYVSRMITLTIHSGLKAVGFLVKITGKLAENGISVNSVSAYYHDHLFVAPEDVERTMGLLRKLSQSG